MEKIEQIISELYSKFIGPYLSVYLSWLTDKLSETNPFAMISISIIFFLVLTIYIWLRNRSI